MSKRVTFCTLLLACILNYAQDFRATISGQVIDPVKAPVPEATVQAINKQNGEVLTTHTNSTWYYSLPFLNPGTYDRQ
jgi:hypothetical protein